MRKSSIYFFGLILLALGAVASFEVAAGQPVNNPNKPSYSCTNASLNGTYHFGSSGGFESSGLTGSTPDADAGAETFDGNGNVVRLSTGTDSTGIEEGTYTIAPNCRGSVNYVRIYSDWQYSIGSEIFVNPNGQSFTYDTRYDASDGAGGHTWHRRFGGVATRVYPPIR